jgi:hypothetical protein
MENKSYITRQEAATMLHVSLRTLDRTIRRKKLKTKRDGKNLLILENDILLLIKDIPIEQEIYKGTTIENGRELADEQKEYAIIPESTTIIFKKLFEEAQRQIEKKEEKIEMLNYKLGQIEAKLKQSIPLLEHKQSYVSKEEIIKEQEKLIQNFSQKVRMMQIVKNVYLILLTLAVICLPFLWFILKP